MTTTNTPTSGAADLRTAAQAVVDRWDTPLWKDVPSTAEYIGRLRAALAAGQATAAPVHDLAAVIKGAADKLDAAVRCHPNAVDTLIHEALEILDGDREPDAIRASHGQAPAQPDPAYSEACNLATALFKKHFAHLPDYASGQVVWGLCDSTAGVISQIDNMVSGLVRPPTTSPQAAECVPAPVPPPECETEAEKRAFAFGWFKALESERMKAESVQEDAARWNAWSQAMVEGANCDTEPEFLRVLSGAIGDAELPITLQQLNAWIDAARAAQKEGEKP